MKTTAFKSNNSNNSFTNLRRTLYGFVFIFAIHGCTADKIFEESLIVNNQTVSNVNVGKQKVTPVSITLTSDFNIIEGLFKHSLAKSLSSSPGQSAYDILTWNRLNGLGLVRARVWLRFKYIYNVTTKTPNYISYQTYMDNWNNGASSLYLNWIIDYEELMASGEWEYNELLTAQTNALAHFKTRYPKIEFIECETNLWILI